MGVGYRVQMRLSLRPNRCVECARNEVRRRGATLIELLVVIALIGLLMGILIPSLSKSVSLAANTMCKNNLREVGYALELYAMDNSGWLPVVKPTPGGLQSIRGAEPWFGKLFPTYLSDPAILACPEDPHRVRMLRARDRVHDPSVSDYSSYGINGFLMAAGAGALAEIQRVQPSRPLDTMLLADSGPDEGGSTVRLYGVVGPARNASVLTWDDGFDPFTRRAAANPWVTTRHLHGINVLTLGRGVRDADTERVIRRPLQRYYDDCASGRCVLCTKLRLLHYSFAKDRLFWWTGSTPPTD